MFVPCSLRNIFWRFLKWTYTRWFQFLYDFTWWRLDQWVYTQYCGIESRLCRFFQDFRWIGLFIYMITFLDEASKSSVIISDLQVNKMQPRDKKICSYLKVCNKVEDVLGTSWEPMGPESDMISLPCGFSGSCSSKMFGWEIGVWYTGRSFEATWSNGNQRCPTKSLL